MWHLLNSCTGGDEISAFTVERGVLPLSPAWLLSAPFLGLVAQTMAKDTLQRFRDVGAEVSIGAGNTKVFQAVNKTNHSTEKHGTSLPLT